MTGLPYTMGRREAVLRTVLEVQYDEAEAAMRHHRRTAEWYRLQAVLEDGRGDQAAARAEQVAKQLEGWEGK